MATFPSLSFPDFMLLDHNRVISNLYILSFGMGWFDLETPLVQKCYIFYALLVFQIWLQNLHLYFNNLNFYKMFKEV